MQELEAVARDWTKPPPDAVFGLRVPVEYASLHAAVRSGDCSHTPRLLTDPTATGSWTLHLCMIDLVNLHPI